MGKELLDNALATRFADFTATSREYLQPVSSTPEKETLHPSVQHEPENKQPATVKGYSGDDSPVGYLLSILTPKRDRYDSNEPTPTKKRRRKTEVWGRQV